MAQAQNTLKESPETVLLRHPLPRHNFQGKKLPKEPSPPPTQATSLPHKSSQTGDFIAPSTTAVVATATYPPNAEAGPSVGLNRKSAAIKPFPLSSSCPKLDSLPAGDKNTKPIAAIVPPNIRSGNGGGSQGKMAVNMVGGASCAGTGGTTQGAEARMTYLAMPTVPSSEPDIPVPDAAMLAHTVEGPTTEEKLAKAESEIRMLKSQLEVQLQVNAEIKRLLVASVGDDFERKVESLARDRAQLAMELGDFTKKMTEDYENLDQISIQADMWRSKYLASRVMVEELASARAFYSSQFQDSQQAVQELLNERYELRTGLVQSYKCLQQVKEAFDPFNAQKSHSLPSTNVLDLAKHIKQLSEAVRFRLLPAHAGSHVMMPLEESWESTMTKAELLAYEQLSKQTTPPSFKHSMPTSSVLSPSKSYERFHPLVRHDNLTVNCCTKCKGEIKVA